MTAALIALIACAWWWTKALLITGSALYFAPRAATWVLVRIERRRLRDMPGPRVAYPLPALDASDEEFDNWPAAAAAYHEAARTDWDNWADYFGTDGAA